MIQQSIVEAIYSMDPPGRFLKKCADTGQWAEMSKTDALDRTAQAMAYAVRVGNKTKEKFFWNKSQLQSSVDVAVSSVKGAAHAPARSVRERKVGRTANSAANDHDVSNNCRSGRSNELLPQQQPLHQVKQACATNLLTASDASLNALSHRLARSQQQPRWTHASEESDRRGEVGRTANSASNEHDDGNGGRPGRGNDFLPQNSILQQQPHQQGQQYSTSTNSYVPLNESAQLLARASLYLQQQQQHELLNRYLISQHPFGSQYVLSSTQSFSVPSSSTQGALLPNDILRQAYLLRGNYGAGPQLNSLLQSQLDPNAVLYNNNEIGNYFQYQNPSSVLGATTAPAPQAAQQLDQVQSGGMLQNQLMSAQCPLNASNPLPPQQQSQLLQQLTVLLQRNSQPPTQS